MRNQGHSVFFPDDLCGESHRPATPVFFPCYTRLLVSTPLERFRTAFSGADANRENEPSLKFATAATLLEVAGYFARAIGLLWAAYNCVFVVKHYIRVPFRDHWSWLDRYYRNGLWRTMLMQHNEHRVFFPSLAYALDQHLGHGLNLLLILLLLCTQLMMFLIVWLPFRTARDFPGGMVAFLGGATAVFATWFLQAENLFWAFQFCLVLSVCWSVASFYCLAKGLAECRGDYHVAAIGCAFIATFSFASGMCTWPLLIALCLLKGRRPFTFSYCAGFALALTLYLHGYQVLSTTNPISSLKDHLVAVIYYFLVYLGRPFIPQSFADFTPGAVTTAAVIGTVGLLTCAGIAVHYVSRQKHEFQQHFYVALMLWAAATGLVTAVGRVNFPLTEVLGSRYVVVQILFWYGILAVLLLIVMRRRLFWPLLPGEIVGLIALLCLLTYPSQRLYGDGYANAAEVLDQQASAASAGVFDVSQWNQGPSITAVAPNVLDALRRTHRGPFAFPETTILGRNVSTLQHEAGCQGSLDEISATSDHRGVRLVGWSWGADGQQVGTIALVDSVGRIVGWAESGIPRPDVVAVFNDPARAHSGWVGYAPAGAVRAFAMSRYDQAACVLPGGGK